MAKVRLVKGPFAGKVAESGMGAGIHTLKYSGPKPMTRKQRYKWLTDERNNRIQYGSPLGMTPMIEAVYQIVMAAPGIPCQHPDGSYFYSYVEGSKKEF